MRIKDIIERNDTYAGKVFDLAIQGLILFSLVTFSIETLPDLGDSAESFLRISEIVAVIIFTVEYILRVIVADKKFAFIFSFYGANYANSYVLSLLRSWTA